MENGIYLLLILIFSTVSIFFKYKSKNLYSLTKTIPIIFLISFFINKSNFTLQIESFVFIGLIFSLFGDIALLFKKYFYAGLIFFLIAHILYFLGFYFYAKDIDFILIIPFVIFSLLFFFNLKLKEVKQKIAIAFYITAISLMGYSALNLFIYELQVSTFLLFLGSILFIFSDSVLAFNKFKNKFMLAELLILSSYYCAQTLIVFGVMLLPH